MQRFFGVCAAQYGSVTDVDRGRRRVRHHDGAHQQVRSRESATYRIRVNPVAWPGYNQLAAQLAAGDPPDLVTMHESAISDYQSRGLLEPIGERARTRRASTRRSFTAASSKGVSKDGKIYGLPFDTWAPLWHINMNHFRAGRAGAETASRSCRRARRSCSPRRGSSGGATGKPYFVQALTNERAAYTRNLYTYLMQQNAEFFADPQRIRLQTPEARRVARAVQDRSTTRT